MSCILRDGQDRREEGSKEWPRQRQGAEAGRPESAGQLDCHTRVQEGT